MPHSGPLRDERTSNAVEVFRALAIGPDPIEETQRRLHETLDVLRRLDRAIAVTKSLMGGDPPEATSD